MRKVYYFVTDENSPYCANGLLFDKTKRRSKYDHPWNYDSFFILGDHESIEGCSPAHTDRYKEWGEKKLEEARVASQTKHLQWDQFSMEDLDRFVKAYHGDEYEATGLVENCRPDNGFPYWSVYFKKVTQ